MILLLWPESVRENSTKVMLMGRVVATSRQGDDPMADESWLFK